MPPRNRGAGGPPVYFETPEPEELNIAAADDFLELLNSCVLHSKVVCPVDQGDLQSTIRFEDYRWPNDGTIVAGGEVGITGVFVDYAVQVHDIGYPPHGPGPRPFLRWGVDRALGELDELAERVAIQTLAETAGSFVGEYTTPDLIRLNQSSLTSLLDSDVALIGLDEPHPVFSFGDYGDIGFGDSGQSIAEVANLRFVESASIRTGRPIFRDPDTGRFQSLTSFIQEATE